jgi:hypothetical protein
MAETCHDTGKNAGSDKSRWEKDGWVLAVPYCRTRADTDQGKRELRKKKSSLIASLTVHARECPCGAYKDSNCTIEPRRRDQL